VTETETSFERTGLVGAGWTRMWAGWHHTVALNYRRDRFDAGLDRGLSDFLVPEASWDRLRSNDPIDPTDGHRVLFRLSAASSALLSDATYVRPEAHAKWLRTFGRRNRVTGRLEAGWVWTKEFRELPPSARFFAGGAESVRGFGYHSLGRRDEAGNVIGGELLAAGSIEYEYRFLDRWGAAVFYDAGKRDGRPDASRSSRAPGSACAGARRSAWCASISASRSPATTTLPSSTSRSGPGCEPHPAVEGAGHRGDRDRIDRGRGDGGGLVGGGDRAGSALGVRAAGAPPSPARSRSGSSPARSAGRSRCATSATGATVSISRSIACA